MQAYLNGVLVRSGDTLRDFRGEKWEFISVSRAPSNFGTGRVTVRKRGHMPVVREFFPSVFGLEITQEAK